MHQDPEVHQERLHRTSLRWSSQILDKLFRCAQGSTQRSHTGLVLKGVTLDWRIVFHTGANNLNDLVWAPSFALPSLNSLLRIIDTSTIMSDRDMGEMFLNFMLDPRVWKYAAIDLGPLGFSQDECRHPWMVWARKLMGFKPSPYNLVNNILWQRRL